VYEQSNLNYASYLELVEQVRKELENEARQGGFGWDKADLGPGGAD